jgi:hypothetical protein
MQCAGRVRLSLQGYGGNSMRSELGTRRDQHELRRHYKSLRAADDLKIRSYQRPQVTERARSSWRPAQHRPLSA